MQPFTNTFTLALQDEFVALCRKDPAIAHEQNCYPAHTNVYIVPREVKTQWRQLFPNTESQISLFTDELIALPASASSKHVYRAYSLYEDENGEDCITAYVILTPKFAEDSENGVFRHEFTLQGKFHKQGISPEVIRYNHNIAVVKRCLTLTELLQLQQKTNQLSPKQVFEHCAKSVISLQEAHRQHGQRIESFNTDGRQDNIVFTCEGKAQLIDFGLIATPKVQPPDVRSHFMITPVLLVLTKFKAYYDKEAKAFSSKMEAVKKRINGTILLFNNVLSICELPHKNQFMACVSHRYFLDEFGIQMQHIDQYIDTLNANLEQLQLPIITKTSSQAITQALLQLCNNNQTQSEIQRVSDNLWGYLTEHFHYYSTASILIDMHELCERRLALTEQRPIQQGPCTSRVADHLIQTKAKTISFEQLGSLAKPTQEHRQYKNTQHA